MAEAEDGARPGQPLDSQPLDGQPVDSLLGSARPQASGAGLPAGSVMLEQDFDSRSLYALRAAVSAHASATGLAGNRLYDVVATAHELAANAVRHGAGRGRLRLWVTDGVLHCEVSDAGRSAAAGAAQAAWRKQHGHGLWVVGQVADQFYVDRSTAATTATATFALTVSHDLAPDADLAAWPPAPPAEPL
jgi:anti-sigma regulatory factor (Ser/Thr protein kinase)